MIKTRALVSLSLLILVGLACVFPRTIPVPTATAFPNPAASKTPTATPTSEPTEPQPTNTSPVEEPTPEATPGANGNSFDGFYKFGAEIDAAIKTKNASFFGVTAPDQEWSCIGDEGAGICRGQPEGKLFTGVPISQDWKNYKVISSKDYQANWQKAFKDGYIYKLAALSSNGGENPFMGLADISYQAILTLSRPGVNSTNIPVHVLYFEYVDGAYLLRGELVTNKSADWLNGKCFDTCYMNWKAWEN